MNEADEISEFKTCPSLGVIPIARTQFSDAYRDRADHVESEILI